MPDRHLTMAYADPPYVGQSKKHYEDHPDYAGEVDHTELIQRLEREYPDGWALSMSVPSLCGILDIAEIHTALRAVPDPKEDPRYRLVAWVKPFAAFKANVRVAYTWEPLLVKVAPRLEGAIPTRDHIAESITMQRGLTGAKPERVCHWLFGVMGLRRTDTLVDLYPGSRAVHGRLGDVDDAAPGGGMTVSLRGSSDSGCLPVDGPGVSAITDHAFVPRGEWWTVCGHPMAWSDVPVFPAQKRSGFPPLYIHRCRLAEAAHAATTVRPEDRT